jgi:hypothetical protein
VIYFLPFHFDLFLRGERIVFCAAPPRWFFINALLSGAIDLPI